MCANQNQEEAQNESRKHSTNCITIRGNNQGICIEIKYRYANLSRWYGFHQGYLH